MGAAMATNSAKCIAKREALTICVGLVVAVAIFILPSLSNHLMESRWFRDVARLTPFHSVTVDDTHLTDGGALVVGQMVKRRCEYHHLTAYVIFSNGYRRRVHLDTSPEGGPQGNRPSSRSSEAWGPWKIVAAGRGIARWEIFAHHKCPERGTIQSNLFATGDWPGDE